MTELPERLDWLVRMLGVHRPTKEQARVITHPLAVSVDGEQVASPLLVVAGAGSGKTETMSLRAVYLAEAAGVPDEAILGLTFTRKAAGELEARLTDRLAQLAAVKGDTSDRGLLGFESAPVATTYNAFALDVVRQFGPLLGLPADLGHLGEAASWQLMLDVVEAWNRPLSGELAAVTVAERAMSLREAIANQGMTLDEARAGLERFSQKFLAAQAARGGTLHAVMRDGLAANLRRLELLDVIAEFETRKQLLARVDFADQVILATRIVKEVPAAREELRRRHRVVFLDEFQDTSVSQLQFLSALFADHPVTAVGDPNQAIYGWRGASAASLEDFHRLFSRDERAPRTTLSLSTAWRNSRTILDVANHIAKPLRQRQPWDGSGEAAAENRALSPVLQPRDGAPEGSVRMAYRQTLDEQLGEIVDFVDTAYRRAAEEGRTATVAVLCRSRRLISTVLEALLEAGFAAETGGADGLLLHPAVLDLRAALEIGGDIGRSSQLLRLLANLDLGSRDLWALSTWARRLARQRSGPGRERPPVLLLEAVDRILDIQPEQAREESKLSAAAVRRLRGLAADLRAIRRATDRTVLEQVEHARRVLGIDQQGLAISPSLDVTEVLDSFTAAAADYQESTINPSLRGFLSWLDAAERRERGLSLPAVPPNPNAVQVMTIHGAKGLEWDAVAVIDMEVGIFPSLRGMRNFSKPTISPVKQRGWWIKDGELPYPVRRDHAHLPDSPIWDPELKAKEIEELHGQDVGAYLEAEERRLAYVAMTRPRHSLLLVGSWLMGGSSPRCPSQFFTEASEIASISVQVDGEPSEEQVAQAGMAEAAPTFPRRPGERRKQMALSARMVEGEMRALDLSGDWRVDLERALASIDDTGMVRRAEFLAAEYFEQRERRTVDTAERAERDVREVASDAAWEFSATQLFDFTETQDIWLDLRRPVPSERAASSGIGTAFHGWVETELRRVPAAGVQSAEFPDAESETGAAQVDVHGGDEEGLSLVLDDRESARLRSLQTHFRDIPWLRHMQVVGIEIPFAVEMEQILLRGRIDAVFKHPEKNEYWLIDWKTGTPVRPNSPSEQIGRYLSQLAIYREAWGRRVEGRKKARGRPAVGVDLELGVEPIEMIAKLVFVSESGVFEVDQEQLQDMYRAATGSPWDLGIALRGLGETLRG